MIQRGGQWNHPLGGHQSVGGLETNSPAVSSRAKDGSAGLATQGQRAMASGHRNGRTGRGSSGCFPGKCWVPSRGRIKTGKSTGLGFPKDQCALGAQAGNHFGILAGNRLLPWWVTGGGGITPDINDVLDPDGHTVQRSQPYSVLDQSVQPVRFGQNPFRPQFCPGLKVVICRGNSF